MKILLVHNKYQQYGGEDGVFNAETELLQSHGNEVDQLTFDNKDIRSWLDKFVSGIQCLYNKDSADKLEEKIKKFQPDVIHVHNFFPLASPAIFYVAQKWRVPIVMTLHNYRLVCPSATLFHNKKIYEKSLRSLIPLDAIVKGVYRDSIIQTASVVAMSALHSVMGTWRTKVDRYIALTHFAKSRFTSSALGIPEEKFVIKPNFVEDHGTGNAVRENFFLFVGRLSEEKGVDLLLEANEKHPFNLAIIGDGPSRSHVEKFSKRFPHVRYLGFQKKDTIMHYMKKCRALLFSSMYYENLPLTILEAFSAGTPVIATGHGASAEIVQNGFNGLTFRPGSVDELIEKVRSISANPDAAGEMGVQARKTYLQYYTPAKNYELLMDIYKDVIKARQIKGVMALNKAA